MQQAQFKLIKIKRLAMKEGRSTFRNCAFHLNHEWKIPWLNPLLSRSICPQSYTAVVRGTSGWVLGTLRHSDAVYPPPRNQMFSSSPLSVLCYELSLLLFFLTYASQHWISAHAVSPCILYLQSRRDVSLHVDRQRAMPPVVTLQTSCNEPRLFSQWHW